MRTWIKVVVFLLTATILVYSDILGDLFNRSFYYILGQYSSITVGRMACFDYNCVVSEGGSWLSGYSGAGFEGVVVSTYSDHAMSGYLFMEKIIPESRLAMCQDRGSEGGGHYYLCRAADNFDIFYLVIYREGEKSLVVAGADGKNAGYDDLCCAQRRYARRKNGASSVVAGC